MFLFIYLFISFNWEKYCFNPNEENCQWIMASTSQDPSNISHWLRAWLKYAARTPETVGNTRRGYFRNLHCRQYVLAFPVNWYQGYAVSSPSSPLLYVFVHFRFLRQKTRPSMSSIAKPPTKALQLRTCAGVLWFSRAIPVVFCTQLFFCQVSIPNLLFE